MKLKLLFLSFIFTSLLNAQIDLGPDIEVCTGNTVILDATIPGESPSYLWLLDNFIPLPESGPTLTVTETGIYSVQANVNGTLYNDEIRVYINDAPTILVNEIAVCDDNNVDGITEIIFSDYFESITIDPINNEVTLHETEADALANINAVSSPYTIVDSVAYFFVRVENISDSCVTVEQFNFFITYTPFANEPSPLTLCSDTNFAVFNLESKTDEINNESFRNVTYHLTQEDADTNSNPIPLNYQNVTNPQTIYARATSASITNPCFNTTTLELMVNNGTVPEANSVNPVELCGVSSNYDLTIFDAVVIGGQTDLTISYFETSNDAVNNVNSIINPVSYPGLTIGPNTVYARVDSNISDCYNYTEISITVNTLPEVNPTSLIGCAIDNSGITSFDLTAQIPIITTEQNVNISFYQTEADALNNINEITTSSNYTNLINPQTIYVRVEDLVTSCIVITTLELTVNGIPQISQPSPLESCDDDNDGFALFDLESKNAEILGGNDPLSYMVTYHETQLDADNGTNAIFAPYTNTIANTQTIYVRVESNQVFQCYNTTTLTLVAVPSPTPVNPAPLLSCDDNNDGIIEFDLITKTNEIINGEADIMVTYHLSLVDAENNTNTIASPYTTPGTIFARASNIITDCYTIVQLELIVETCPEIVNCTDVPFNFEYCYDINDSTEYTFESSDGSPLILSFNSGEVEFDYDFLVVLDSDGVTNLNTSTPYGNNGDLTDLVFNSSGNRISFYVDSDAIISCSTEGYTPINFDVFCANAFGIINVNAFEDSNSNGVFDANESNYSNGYFTYELNNDGNINAVNSSTGSFNILSDINSNSYDITFNLFDDYASCYTVTTSPIENLSVNNGSILTVDIPIVQNSTCEDLGIYLVNPNIAPRPGFSHTNILTLENLGNTTITNGTVEFISDANLSVLNTSSTNNSYVITTTATGFTVDFTNLAPGESEDVIISLSTEVTTTLGTLVTNEANYTTTTNDLITGNNNTELTEVVIGSWDPNDKMEAHGPDIIYNDFIASDEYLYYTIRFQNLGTAEAINVRIEDVLNTQLDESTFQMLRSSHDYVATQSGTDLEWLFQNINLPAEQDDTAGSQGFVYFKIKPKSGYSLNDMIPNYASIFFDFNAPVITNTFETRFVEILNANEFNSSTFLLYPNPANDSVTILFNSIYSESIKIKIIDIHGKLVSQNDLDLSNSIRLDTSGLQNGLYFVQLSSRLGHVVKKLIKE